MPRPKGSKNKAKPTTISTTDFTSLIAEKSSTKEALVADIASLEENLANIKADLKAKKAELKKQGPQSCQKDKRLILLSGKIQNNLRLRITAQL